MDQDAPCTQHYSHKVGAFYRFFPFEDYQAFQKPWRSLCEEHRIKGTLLLASEGINGTLAALPEDLDAFFKDWRAQYPFLKELTIKYSVADAMPFWRLKVALRSEIVTLRAPQVDPLRRTGTYVQPEAWNQLIERPDVIVVDTRNDYEVAVGTFKHALDPNIQSFEQFKTYTQQALHKDQKVAMFCTGGIRCEKAAAYLLEEGFSEVYQLEGGILNYLEKVNPDKSLWEGECFVFDHRVTVKHDLTPGETTLCFGCRHPLNQRDRESPDFETGVQCPYCKDTLTDSKRSRLRARQQQMTRAAQLKVEHLGQVL